MTPTRTARDFAIRRCTTGDAAMIAELGARLFAQTYGATHPEPELRRYLDRAFAVGDVTSAIADKEVTMFVAEDHGARPIGYAFLRKTGALPDGVTSHNSYEVVRFYVDADAQGRGVGRALMEMCLDDARRRGADTIWVQAWTQAPWAVGFYERMGFSAVGSASFSIGAQIDDDQIMSRTV